MFENQLNQQGLVVLVVRMYLQDSRDLIVSFHFPVKTRDGFREAVPLKRELAINPQG
jgi:hypothetical protein